MITRFTIALALIVAFASAAPAKKKSTKVNGRESSGFNGITYVLQKPLGNPSFPEGEKGFGQHIYFGFNAGGSLLTNNIWDNTRPGFKVGAHLGGWITPVHGLRLTGNVGKFTMPAGSYSAWNGSFRADYMINLTSLLRGYDPNRKFELLGGTGLIYQYVRQHGKISNNFGGAASLQMRFNLTNSFYMFVEPEVSMLAGRKPAMASSWSGVYTDLSLNVGLGYRILTGKQRQEGATKFEQSPEDNIFYGVAGGLFGIGGGGTKFNSPIASLFLGKMFSSTSGIQLSGRYGHIHNAPKSSHRNFAIGSVDYVLNMNNAFSGYRPDDVFQLLLNVGPSAVLAQNTSKMHAGVHAGLTGLFRLSPNWGLFVSPQVYGFANGFNKEIGMHKRPLVSIDLGLRYTVGDFSCRFKNTHFTPTDSTQRWFVNAAVGGGLRHRFGHHPLLDGYVGIGRRFTPISSWRLNIDGQYIRHYGSLTANIDYLSSITTAMCGYKEDRIFDLQAVAGVFAGGAQHKGDKIKATLGAKAGFQANFRLTQNWSIYLEPQLLAVYGTNQYDYSYWSPDMRMQLGVTYKW